jgi:Holliday junction resolvasome RuvABC endonuclease subunit
VTTKTKGDGMKIMAIDYGQHCGIAIGYMGVVTNMEIRVNPYCLAIDCGKKNQVATFYDRLMYLVEEHLPHKIVYASVFHPPKAGAQAAHLWGAYWGASCIVASDYGMPEPEAYSEMSAKKYFTGSGRAIKQDVIAACIRHGYEDILPTVGTRKPRISEDAADALMLLCFAGRLLG